MEVRRTVLIRDRMHRAIYEKCLAGKRLLMDMNKRIPSLGCILLVAALVGCGSSQPDVPPPSKKIVPKFVYIANYGSASVSAFSVTASTGNLSPVPGSPFPTGSMPFALVLDSSAKFLYVINHGAFEISV